MSDHAWDIIGALGLSISALVFVLVLVHGWPVRRGRR